MSKVVAMARVLVKVKVKVLEVVVVGGATVGPYELPCGEERQPSRRH